MSNVLIAAGSPIGSSRMSTMRGSRLDDVRRDLDLVQVDAELAGDLPGVDGVVGHRLEPLVLGAEGDGVGVDARVGLVRPAR